MTKIIIPEGEYCRVCKAVAKDFNEQYYCVLFGETLYKLASIWTFKKCQQCLNKEQIIIQYGEADENQNT